MVLEKTLESPLDCKEIQQVHSEVDQPWDFFGKNDAKAETPVLWLGSSLRSPAEGEGNEGFPPPPDKDLEAPGPAP